MEASPLLLLPSSLLFSSSLLALAETLPALGFFSSGTVVCPLALVVVVVVVVENSLCVVHPVRQVAPAMPFAPAPFAERLSVVVVLPLPPLNDDDDENTDANPELQLPGNTFTLVLKLVALPFVPRTRL